MTTGLNIQFADDSFDRLQELAEIGFSDKRIRGAVYTIINQVAKDAISPAAKLVQSEINLKQGVIKKAIKVTKKAKRGSLLAVVSIKKSERPSLKEFKLKKQLVKTGKKKSPNGISYQIIKGKTRKFRKGFVVDKFNGHAFVNIGGRKIAKLHGASAWGVWKKHRLSHPLTFDIRKRLTYRIDKFIKDQIRKYNFKINSGA
tara:strand:- start:5462 stop:6064 length:603 start_codon:yes stop_codon:yes gene_type:complete